MCLALSLWNDEDHILKERLFGVTGHQGNHGEDVKELYWYLDSTPTHSYMKFLYKYPQRAFPYDQLVQESQNRGRDVPEFEILDTNAFDENRYWDVFVEVGVPALRFTLFIDLPSVRKGRGRRFEYLRSHHRLQQRTRSRYIAHPSSVLVP